MFINLPSLGASINGETCSDLDSVTYEVIKADDNALPSFISYDKSVNSLKV